jgi:hypothetical protein
METHISLNIFQTLNIFNWKALISIIILLFRYILILIKYFNHSLWDPYGIHWLQEYCNILQVTFFIYYISVSWILGIEIPEDGVNEYETGRSNT